jgi:hypothetical protein
MGYSKIVLKIYKLTMKKATLYFLMAVLLFNSNHALAQVTKAPAYPLINHNPYFSIWSFSDHLNQSTTKHWTGSPNSILGLIKVDGKVFRFLGKEDTLNKLPIDLAKQESMIMNATQTSYVFSCGGVELSVVFTSPLLINDISILSRPVSYINMKTKAIDGKKHQTSFLLSASSLIASNNSNQEITSVTPEPLNESIEDTSLVEKFDDESITNVKSFTESLEFVS